MTIYPATTAGVHGICTKIEQMLGSKIRLNKFRKTYLLQTIFSDHNGIINQYFKISKWKLHTSKHPMGQIRKW